MAKATRLKIDGSLRAVKPGKKVRSDLFDILIYPNKGKTGFAVTVSTQISKKATRRNRTRRLVAAAISSLAADLDGYNLIFRIKKDLSEFKSDQVRDEILKVLSKRQ